MREARKKQHGYQSIAEHDQEKRAKAGELKELVRRRLAAAGADGMLRKDLQTAVLAIHRHVSREEGVPSNHLKRMRQQSLALLAGRTVKGNWPREGADISGGQGRRDDGDDGAALV